MSSGRLSWSSTRWSVAFGREFERRFVLPSEADTEHVKAVFGKGVLEVHAQKLQTAKPKQVEITNA